MYTIEQPLPKPGRRRRTHSLEFKAQAVARCRQPGISVSAVALSCGIDANLLRRWILVAQTSTVAGSAGSKQAEFISLPLARQTAPPAVTAADIRIEIRRAATCVSILWPVHAGADCASLLRELLR